MDIYTWVVFLYVAGSVLVGWFLFAEYDLFRFFKSDKKHVGPSYWGVYKGASSRDIEAEKVIELQKIEDEYEEHGVCGGRAYGTGKAVRSCRV